MINQLLRPALAVPLLFLCGWPAAGIAQAAIADAVMAWGANGYGQTTVPVEAQYGVTALAAGMSYTVALKSDGSVMAWGNSDYGLTTLPPAAQSRVVALVGGVQLLPALKATPHGNQLILSWPTNVVGFTLQSTLDLTPPVAWIDSTSVPTVVGAQFSLTTAPSAGARFYRLRKMQPAENRPLTPRMT